VSVTVIALLAWAGSTAGQPERPVDVVVEAAPVTPLATPETLPTTTPASKLAARVDRFVLEGPRFLSSVARMPLAELRGLAPLLSERSSQVANPHDPVKLDEYRTLVFEGLEIHGYLGDHGDLWPVRITVSNPRWAIADDLNVGSDVMRIKEVLGEPAVSRPEAWLYQGAFQSVNFTLQKDRIEKIEFIYYLD